MLGYAAWASRNLGGSYWDTDEGINLMKARLLQLGYPLYLEVWADQPPGLAALLATAFRVLGPEVEVARGVVLALAVLGLVGIAWITREASGGWPAALIAVVAAATAPNFFWASRAVMIGLPALCLATLSLASLLAFCRCKSRVWLAASGALMGMSLSIKLIGAYLAVPFLVGVLLTRRGGGRGWLRAAAADVAVLAASAALTAAPMLLAFDARAMADQVVGTVSRARGAYPLDLAWNADKLWFWLSGDQLALAALAAYGAIALAARRTVAAAVILTWLVATLAALLLQSPLWPKHHFLALLVVLAPLAGIGAEDFARRVVSALRGATALKDVAWLAAGAAAVTVALAGVPAAGVADAARVEALPYKESGKLPKNDAYVHQAEAIAMVERWTRPDDTIVTDHHLVAFAAGRVVPPELAVISGKRIATGELDTAAVIAAADRADAAAVLLWSGDRLQTLPGFADWVRANFRLADEIGDDFQLYVAREAAGGR